MKTNLLRGLLLTAPLILLPKLAALAQTAAVTQEPGLKLSTMAPLTLVLGSFFGLVLLLIFIYLIIVLSQIVPSAQKVYAQPDHSESLVGKTLGVLRGDATPLTGRYHDVVLEGHDYDGIHEFDNDLPPWWKYLFYATIVFAVGYMLHFHVFQSGKLQDDEYQYEIQQAALLHPNLGGGEGEEKFDFTVLTDGEALESGKAAYVQNCAACHGQEGEGKIGPNLADEYWLHGGDVNSIFKTIKVGVTSKGMVAWQGKLSNDQILEVSSYILSLQGTNPANAKEPQGEKKSL